MKGEGTATNCHFTARCRAATQEYATLKGDMLRNTAQLGAFLTLYLGLTQHDTMAFARCERRSAC